MKKLPGGIRKGLGLTLLFGSLAACNLSSQELLLIQGASGDESYQEHFETAGDIWIELAEQAGFQATRIQEPKQEIDPADLVLNWVSEHKKSPELWIVYLGHGTHSKSAAKLNLIGPDLNNHEFAEAFADFSGKLVFVHGGSASAPFIPSLSGKNRIIITATRSGSEGNYARFGALFAEAIKDTRSDLDLDGEISLLEAFVTATQNVESFYFEAGRLTTEHALIDDNGDLRGSQADLFDGLRPVASLDPENADGFSSRRTSLNRISSATTLSNEQLSLRDKLEVQLDELRTKRTELVDAEYFRQLESILTELSQLYLPQTDSDS
ncbi:hypothetical protein [Pelagicoccus albus]|uniref:Caspase domain-containing protein n=1 Tax=Pelagicoccus albus TaxID=415222 RepID=A0A7X1B349_9BACT|nr:hypothetical protein [Pelagicoccus albus]MBC2604781.1 hypothetical protein [Pelagicoccus albus]